MKELTVVTILLVTVFVFIEGKRHHDEYKLDKKSFIHMDLKKHPHHGHGRSRLRGSHLDMTEVIVFKTKLISEKEDIIHYFIARALFSF